MDDVSSELLRVGITGPEVQLESQMRLRGIMSCVCFMLWPPKRI